MKKYPFEHRIQKPFKYVPAASTNIAKTFREVRKSIETKDRPAANNVAPLRKRAA